MGSFAGIVIDERGEGIALTDPFSQRSLYLARGRRHQIVASNPSLAAWSVKGAVVPPELDPLGVCGLAYTKHLIGERTGFAGVRSLPIGKSVKFAPGSGATAIDRSPPWEPQSDLQTMTAVELLDLAHEALAEELRASLTFPSRLVFTDLTGGKDSRLILAVALTAGLSDQMVFRTDGPLTIADVTIAKELAALARLRWIGSEELPTYYRNHLGAPDPNSTIDLPNDTSWAQSARNYARTTAGICNLWQPKPSSGDSRVARISGLTGEGLRSTLGFDLPTETALVRRFDRHFGHLELLQPDALQRYRREWIDDLLGDKGTNASCNDRYDAFLLRTQVRSNFGPRQEVTPIHLLMPLSSLIAVRAAFALGGAARTNERIHHEIVTRASPALAHHRFAKGGWQSARAAPSWAKSRPDRRTRADLYRRRLDRPPQQKPAKSIVSTSLSNHRRHIEGSRDRIDLLNDLLADRSNGAWTLIDRTAVAEATRRYDLLSQPAQVELMGAATAALWLADGPGRLAG